MYLKFKYICCFRFEVASSYQSISKGWTLPRASISPRAASRKITWLAAHRISSVEPLSNRLSSAFPLLLKMLVASKAVLWRSRV